MSEASEWSLASAYLRKRGVAVVEMWDDEDRSVCIETSDAGLLHLWSRLLADVAEDVERARLREQSARRGRM